jgi:hypothetical protein
VGDRHEDEDVGAVRRLESIDDCPMGISVAVISFPFFFYGGVGVYISFHG